MIEIKCPFYRTLQAWARIGIDGVLTGRRAHPANDRSEAVLSERPNCLVIDDHPLVRLGVRGVLEDDFEVHESVSREEALELVRDIGDFDVTIVDMRWRQNGAVASISARAASSTTIIRSAHQRDVEFSGAVMGADVTRPGRWTGRLG